MISKNLIQSALMIVGFLLMNNEYCMGQQYQYNMRPSDPRYNQSINYYNNGMRYNSIPHNYNMYGQHSYVQSSNRPLQPYNTALIMQQKPITNYSTSTQVYNNQLGKTQYQTNNNVPSQNNTLQNKTPSITTQQQINNSNTKQNTNTQQQVIKSNNNNTQSVSAQTQQLNNNISMQLSRIEQMLNTMSSQLNTIMNNLNTRGTVKTTQQSNNKINQNLNQNISKENSYMNAGTTVTNMIVPGSEAIVQKVASNKDVQNMAKNILNDPKTKQLAQNVQSIIPQSLANLIK